MNESIIDEIVRDAVQSANDDFRDVARAAVSTAGLNGSELRMTPKLKEELGDVVAEWFQKNKDRMIDPRFRIGEDVMDAIIERVTGVVLKLAKESDDRTRNADVKVVGHGTVRVPFTDVCDLLNALPEWYECAYALYATGKMTKDEVAEMSPQAVTAEWHSTLPNCAWIKFSGNNWFKKNK